MSMKGQSTSGWALATACGPLADAPEKKFVILSLKDGEPVGAGGGSAALDGAGVAPTGGAAGVSVAALLPLHPEATSTSDSNAATGQRLHHRIRSMLGGIPHFIAINRDALYLIPKQPWPSQGSRAGLVKAGTWRHLGGQDFGGQDFGGQDLNRQDLGASFKRAKSR